MADVVKQNEMTVSAALQLGPWLRPDGKPFNGDLQTFTIQLTEYLAEQLVRFAESRNVDVFLAVTAKRGEEHAGHSFRNGHYVQEPTT